MLHRSTEDLGFQTKFVSIICALSKSLKEGIVITLIKDFKESSISL